MKAKKRPESAVLESLAWRCGDEHPQNKIPIMVWPTWCLFNSPYTFNVL